MTNPELNVLEKYFENKALSDKEQFTLQVLFKNYQRKGARGTLAFGIIVLNSILLIFLDQYIKNFSESIYLFLYVGFFLMSFFTIPTIEFKWTRIRLIKYRDDFRTNRD